MPKFKRNEIYRVDKYPDWNLMILQVVSLKGCDGDESTILSGLAFSKKTGDYETWFDATINPDDNVTRIGVVHPYGGNGNIRLSLRVQNG